MGSTLLLKVSNERFLTAVVGDHRFREECHLYLRKIPILDVREGDHQWRWWQLPLNRWMAPSIKSQAEGGPCINSKVLFSWCNEPQAGRIKDEFLHLVQSGKLSLERYQYDVHDTSRGSLSFRWRHPKEWLWKSALIDCVKWCVGNLGQAKVVLVAPCIEEVSAIEEAGHDLKFCTPFLFNLNNWHENNFVRFSIFRTCQK